MREVALPTLYRRTDASDFQVCRLLGKAYYGDMEIAEWKAAQLFSNASMSKISCSRY
jgi:hypothetical protein